jgi:hypothetical protein
MSFLTMAQTRRAGINGGASLLPRGIVRRTKMVKLAFFARFEAKPGKEEAVRKFLDMARDMAKN